MTRIVACIVVALLYFVLRGGIPIPPVVPAPPTPPAVVPVQSLQQFVSRMSREDRDALSQAYAVLAKSVAANPEGEPVFATTGAVRAAHRAALLCVWKGVLGNEAGKYEGLREALEGVIAERLGDDDIPLNPTSQKNAVDAFNDIAATLR